MSLKLQELATGCVGSNVRTDIVNIACEVNDQDNLFKDKTSTADVTEIRNDKSTPVKSKYGSNNCAALGEPALELCDCSCHQVTNADLEGIKLDDSPEPQIFEAAS